jgi:ABC-type molybdate transport system substrate-binding protein
MRAWLAAIMIGVTSSASAADIKVMAAGRLKDAFAAVFADFSKQYGGSFMPEYGPSGGLRERLQKGEAFDVFASAALPHAQALTNAGISGPTIMFARNALCVATEASRPLVSGNLVEMMLKPEVRIGTSTPLSDPAGDYTWEMFHKIDVIKPGAFTTLSQKARQLIGGPTATAAVNGWPRLLVALDNDEIDLFIYYCAGAQQIVRGRPGIRTDGLAQGAASGRRFRNVSDVAASAGDAEIVWLHSGGAAQWAVAVHAWQASAPSLYGSG